jgi:hypothetical protein
LRSSWSTSKCGAVRSQRSATLPTVRDISGGFEPQWKPC